MRVGISNKPVIGASRTRGVGAYTRELMDALRENFPADEFLPLEQTTSPFDLVHYPYFDPFFLTLPVRRKYKTVVTIHDVIPLRFPAHFPAGVRGKLKFKIQQRALSTVEHVITDSQASAADIVKYLRFPANQISVIPLAPGLERSTQTITGRVKEEYSLPNRFLLYVGDINWNKNIPSLIRSFAALQDPRTHLVLVGKVFGDRPDIPEFHAVKKEIANSACSPRIHLIGYVPQHHLPLFYRLATLYVQPSWYEGFGLPILEAMHQGCPVLSSKEGSLPEVGGEAVSYFDPHNKSSLTTALSKLLSDPVKRRKLKEAGLAQAKLFSWKQTATLTHELYEALIK